MIGTSHNMPCLVLIRTEICIYAVSTNSRRLLLEDDANDDSQGHPLLFDLGGSTTRRKRAQRRRQSEVTMAEVQRQRVK